MINRFIKISTLSIILSYSSIFAANMEVENADAQYQNQQWQLAAESYESLTNADSSNSQYWFRLGQSQFQLQVYDKAIEALQKAVELADQTTPLPVSLLLLARSQAAVGNSMSAIESLAAIEITGTKPYQAIINAEEFTHIKHKNEFLQVLEKLKPCNTTQHRAFDFWLGEWEVTTPTRPGWVANSSISLANDGCSLHERYSSPGGYSGNSINFYDAQQEIWHQTWIDNQGAPLYLQGSFENGVMRLANSTSRITWSVLPDERVRQLWESTADDGKSWNILFDGYYSKN